jgi:hypothetical protein
LKVLIALQRFEALNLEALNLEALNNAVPLSNQLIPSTNHTSLM